MPLIALLALSIVGAFAATNAAEAGTLRWKVTSHDQYIVQLEFFSDDRDHAWPGGDDAYELRDSKEHSYSLSCQTGEKICYGAWVKGASDEYWGVGPYGDEGCDDCCAICGRSKTQVIDLVD